MESKNKESETGSRENSECNGSNIITTGGNTNDKTDTTRDNEPGPGKSERRLPRYKIDRQTGKPLTRKDELQKRLNSFRIFLKGTNAAKQCTNEEILDEFCTPEGSIMMYISYSELWKKNKDTCLREYLRNLGWKPNEISDNEYNMIKTETDDLFVMLKKYVDMAQQKLKNKS